jgi:hypothetical protein
VFNAEGGPQCPNWSIRMRAPSMPSIRYETRRCWRVADLRAPRQLRGGELSSWRSLNGLHDMEIGADVRFAGCCYLRAFRPGPDFRLGATLEHRRSWGGWAIGGGRPPREFASGAILHLPPSRSRLCLRLLQPQASPFFRFSRGRAALEHNGGGGGTMSGKLDRPTGKQPARREGKEQTGQVSRNQ